MVFFNFFILRVPSMMMAGGKKEMLSRNVLIFRRKITLDSNGCVLDKLEKSAGTIDFSKNRPTDGSSQNQQQATLSDAYIGDFELAANEFDRRGD
jgi:hypothetical protein